MGRVLRAHAPIRDTDFGDLRRRGENSGRGRLFDIRVEGYVARSGRHRRGRAARRVVSMDFKSTGDSDKHKFYYER